MNKRTAKRSEAAVFFPVADLVPWAKNPRVVPTEAALEKLCATIRELGWGAPVLARAADKRVIAGHTRLLAAAKLGLAEVPVRFLDVTEAQADQLALADNRLAEDGEWNYEDLANLLRDMDEPSRLLTGFDAHELEPLLAASWTPPKLELGDRSTPRKIELTAEEAEVFDRSYVSACAKEADLSEGAFVARLCS